MYMYIEVYFFLGRTAEGSVLGVQSVRTQFSLLIYYAVISRLLLVLLSW